MTKQRFHVVVLDGLTEAGDVHGPYGRKVADRVADQLRELWAGKTCYANAWGQGSDEPVRVVVRPVEL